MKAALYARVSTDTEEHIGDSRAKRQDPEVQLIKLRNFAQSRGFDVFGEYVDRASGSDSARPGLDRMMRDAFARKFDTILIVRLDRMMRSLKNLLNILEGLQKYKIALIATDQAIESDTPSGKLMIHILGALAEWEKEIIQARVKDGMAKARMKGTKSGNPIGKPPTYSMEQINQAKDLLKSNPNIPMAQLAREVGMDRRTLRRKVSYQGSPPLEK